MGRFKEFSNLIRLPLGIMASISGLAAGIISIIIENSGLNLFNIIEQYLGQIIIGVPIPLLIVCGAMAINDYYDYSADLKNNRLDRPLVTGTFSKSFALYLSIIMLFLGGFLTIILFLLWPNQVELYLVPAVMFFIFISFSYSTWMKKYGLLGNIAVSSSYPAAIILAMGVVGVKSLEAILTIVSFGFMVFLTALGREVLKGIMDVEGDKEAGVKTIAIRYGEKNAAYISTFLFMLAIPLAPIPLIMSFWKQSPPAGIIYSIFITLTFYFMLKSGFSLIKSPTKTIGIKGRKNTKLGFWALVIGFFLASLIMAF